MPRVETGQPHQLAYMRRFHRVVRLLGCAMFFMGLMVAVVPRFGRGPQATPAGPLATLAIGPAAAVVGVVLLFGRRGKLFDAAAGTLTEWWGAPWPVWRRRHALTEFHALSIEAADDGSAPRWRVELHGSQGTKLRIFELADLATARTAAGQIGTFLAVPILTVGAAAPAGTMPVVVPSEPTTAGETAK